jgi:hypothetical protein
MYHLTFSSRSSFCQVLTSVLFIRFRANYAGMQHVQKHKTLCLNGPLCLFYIYFLIYLFWWEWDLNLGLHSCKANTLQLEPHFQCNVLVLMLCYYHLELLNNFGTGALVFILHQSSQFR